jgi:hypothetical protein
MHTAYLVITVVFALLVSFSGIGKIRRDPRQVKVTHETVGVPLKYFPLLRWRSRSSKTYRRASRSSIRDLGC